LRVLRELRPNQRDNVVFVQRDGAARVIAYDPVVQGPQIAALARERVRPVAPRVAIALPRVAIVAPRIRLPRIVQGPFVMPHFEPRVPGLLALRSGRLFVPTQPGPKPAAHAPPTPAPVDLAWLYAHRFDVPQDGRRVPGVPVRSQVSSPFDIDSGAFHGVRAVNGWSAVRAEVSIPCGVRHFVTGPGVNDATGEAGTVDQETGYVYIGGWGAGPHGVSVDAGLQKSSSQADSDDYAFYWKYATNKPITSEDRFPCGGPDVVLELYPVSDTLLVFSATGVTADGTRRTFTAVQQTRPADGWSPDGGSRGDGVILKRIVAIAQPSTWRRQAGKSHAERFVSGSYFGVAGPHDLKPRIVWRDCEIGHVVPPSIVPQYRPWTAAETWVSSVPGSYDDWPPLGVVRRSAGTCDAAGIYLRA
jgi:hypothetical protein